MASILQPLYHTFAVRYSEADHSLNDGDYLISFFSNKNGSDGYIHYDCVVYKCFDIYNPDYKDENKLISFKYKMHNGTYPLISDCHHVLQLALWGYIKPDKPVNTPGGLFDLDNDRDQ